MPHRIPEIGPAPFITFYSFKGGVGRSMAVMNIGSLLATRGFRVLVLDMDLEAPGASYLLQNQNKQQEQNPIPPQNLLGFVDLFGEANTKGEDADMGVLTPSEIVAKYTHPLALFEIPKGEDVVQNPGGQLRIMPAGRPGTDYARRLQDLDLPGLYQEGVGKPLIAAFKKIIQDSNEFDFVLVDSRTGFSDESGICTRDLADRLVVITGLNHQNVEGTAAFFRALRACTDGNTPVQVVLSPVPQGEDELVSQREDVARSAFRDAWTKPLDISLQIPYHPRLALTEEPYSTRRVHSEIRNAYKNIEAKLLQDMGFSAASLVQQAAKAIDLEQYEQALRKMQLAVRFNGGAYAVTKVGIKLLTPFRREPALRPLYRFLVEQLPLDSALLNTLGAALYERNDELCGIAFERLATAFPTDAYFLCNYALFLTSTENDHNVVEAYYKRALAAAPSNAAILGNYAMFLFAQGRHSEGIVFLNHAFYGTEQTRALLAELNFYSYAHLWQESPNALPSLKGLLLSGARSPNWPLDRNVAQSKSQGHPHPDLVAALAEVISNKAPIASLDAFPVWQATQALPPADSVNPAS